MVLALLLLLQSAPQEQSGPDITVTAPPQATQQVPATMVVEPAAMFIAACDSDGDARTSRAELTTCIDRAFATADPKNTRQIRYIAYGDWALQWLGDRAALPSPYEVDRDSDNVVTLDELQVHFGRLFSRYDVDRDGEVTRAELLTFKARAIDAKGPIGPKPGEIPPQKPRGRRR